MKRIDLIKVIPIKTIKTLIKCLALVISILVVITSMTYGYWARRLIFDTHCVITERAISDLSPSEYPDIRKFASSSPACDDETRAPLRYGASDEDAHYEKPRSLGRGKQFWFRNEGLWADYLLSEEYSKFMFQNAYLHMGYIIHLVEDQTVPAHVKVVFHGPAPPFPDASPYYYDPSEEAALPVEALQYRGIPITDDLESYTATICTPTHCDEAQNCDDNDPLCWDEEYAHVRYRTDCPVDTDSQRRTCMWKFWLSAAEEGRGILNNWQEGIGPARTWGGWGRGCEQPSHPGDRCRVPFHYGSPCFEDRPQDFCSHFGDWYRGISPSRPEIAQGQLWLAHQRAKEMLAQLSEALPPLFRNYQLSQAQFTPSQGTRITFQALENRKKEIKITIQAVQLDDQNIPIPGTERPIVTPEGAWLQREQNLEETPPEDLTRLPFEGSFTLNWYGDVVGEPLQNGIDYALWLKIYDSDNNESEDVPDPERDQLWFSLRKFKIIEGMIASSSVDRTIKLWNAGPPYQLITTLSAPAGHADSVRSVAWSRDRRQLASGSSDRTVKIWDAASEGYPLIATLTEHTHPVWAVTLSPNGQRVASGSSVGTIRIWERRDDTTYRQIHSGFGHSGAVWSIAWSPDERSYASGGADGAIKIWNATTFRTTRTISNAHTGTAQSVAWSPNSQRVASGGVDRTIKIWDATATSGGPLHTLNGHTNTVYSVAWSPNERWIASASADRTIKIWDATTGILLETLTRHTGPVQSVAWSRDSRRLVSGSGPPENGVKVWNISPPGSSLITTLTPQHTGLVWSVAW